jgi:hypothetical protein
LAEVFDLAHRHGKTEAAVRLYAARDLGIRKLDDTADAATLAKLMRFAMGAPR